MSRWIVAGSSVWGELMAAVGLDIVLIVILYYVSGLLAEAIR